MKWFPQLVGDAPSKFDTSKYDTLIGVSTFSGSIEFTGTIRIEGVVNGNVTKFGNEANVILAKAGRIAGSVNVDRLVIEHGTVEGSVTVRQDLVVKSGAIILGNVSYRSLSVEKGAIIRGTLTQISEEENDASAGAVRP